MGRWGVGLMVGFGGCGAREEGPEERDAADVAEETDEVDADGDGYPASTATNAEVYAGLRSTGRPPCKLGERCMKARRWLFVGLLAVGGDAFAGTSEFLGAVGTAEPLYAKASALLDGTEDRVIAGTSDAALLETGRALAEATLASAQALRALSEEERAAPGVAEAWSRFEDCRALLVRLGRARPEIWLSPEGANAGADARSRIERAQQFLREAREAPHQRERAMRDAIQQFEKGKTSYNGMTVADRITPTGQFLAADLAHLHAELHAEVKADEARAARQAEAEPVCRSFRADLIDKDDFSAHMSTLLSGKRGEGWLRTYQGDAAMVRERWGADIAGQLAMFESVQASCGDRDLLSLCTEQVGADRVSGLWASTDPVVWCQLADEGPDLLKAELDHHIGKLATYAAVTLPTPEELRRREGWFFDDRPITWTSTFTVTDDQVATLEGTYAPLYAALGRTLDTDAFAARRAKLDALRAVAEELAPTLARPAAGVRHYGVDHATAGFQRSFPGSRVVAAAGSPGEWRIATNVFGIPTERTRGGWILAQVPGEPFCQLRTFVLAEPYAGGGTWQRGSHVVWSGVRWQACGG